MYAMTHVKRTASPANTRAPRKALSSSDMMVSCIPKKNSWMLAAAQKNIPIVVPGWDTAPTEAGDHLLFNLGNLSTLLSWAKPQHGLLTEDLPAINKQLLAMAREARPV